MDTRIVTLILTRGCNLRCEYCYVQYDDKEAMSLETAQKIICDEMSQASNGVKLVISFLGGEPFTEFCRLREICEWLWSERWAVPYYISVVTNGTIITDEIRQWLIENHNRLYLTLSYDGVIEAQNKNRSNRASNIDLDFFHKYWPEIPIKMTITEDNVGTMYDNITYLNQKGILVNDTFADNSPAWRTESLELLDLQLSKLCAYYLVNQNIKPSEILNINLIPVLTKNKRDIFDCGAGKDKITYDAHGTAYICHLLSPLALSDCELQNLEIDLRNPKESTKCAECVLTPICSFCPGMSFLSKRTCWVREDKNCSLFKHQVYHACSYQLRKILGKKSSVQQLDDYDKYTYLSIKYIISKNII